jgi:hypothetical protein
MLKESGFKRLTTLKRRYIWGFIQLVSITIMIKKAKRIILFMRKKRCDLVQDQIEQEEMNDLRATGEIYRD